MWDGRRHIPDPDPMPAGFRVEWSDPLTLLCWNTDKQQLETWRVTDFGMRRIRVESLSEG